MTLYLLAIIGASTSVQAAFQTIDGGRYAESAYKDVRYLIFAAQPEHVQLLWQDSQRKNYSRMRRAISALEAQGKKVVMMMNAGIFDTQNMPAGLWIEKGEILRPLNTNKGKGNFHIQPNGVFWISGQKAGIVTTEAWKKKALKVDYAVQSGPMLVIDGKINTRFIKNQSSSHKRNAVCITKDDQLYFAITIKNQVEWPSLYRFSEALQSFGCQQALYLDGSLSDYYLAGKKGSFHWADFVGMIAVTTTAR